MARVSIRRILPHPDSPGSILIARGSFTWQSGGALRNTTISPTKGTVMKHVQTVMLTAVSVILFGFAGQTVAAVHDVAIENFAFSPEELTVEVGDTVRFTNNDAATHTATDDEGSFDTGNLSNGESAMISFPNEGTFSYFCEIHPSMTGSITVTASSVDDVRNATPTTAVLHSAYPNPFNGSATIQFTTPRDGFASLSVFDVLGREVATLTQGVLAAGRHEVSFRPSGLAAGKYFYRLNAGDAQVSGSMLYVK